MQGSIQKRVGKRGTVWTAVIDLARDPATGKRRQRRLTAPTKKEVQDLVAKALHDLQTGSYIEPNKLTVGEWLREWLDAHPCRDTTWVRYDYFVRCQLVPELGAIPLVGLRPTHVQTFYQRRLAAGAAPSTVLKAAMVLHSALGQAVKQRLVHTNVAAQVPKPRVPRQEMQCWTKSEMQQFLCLTADDSYGLLYELALKTGMRCGELLALRWMDINLDESWLTIHRTVTRSRTGWTIGDVKTPSSRRRIRLSGALVNKLETRRQDRPRRLEAGPPGEDQDLIFTTEEGRLLRPVVASTRFHKLLKRLGLRLIRFHDMRHTFATLALQDGAKPKAVSAQLGHSSVATTLDLYAHVTQDMEVDLADRMEALSGAVTV